MPVELRDHQSNPGGPAELVWRLQRGFRRAIFPDPAELGERGGRLLLEWILKNESCAIHNRCVRSGTVAGFERELAVERKISVPRGGGAGGRRVRQSSRNSGCCRNDNIRRIGPLYGS